MTLVPDNIKNSWEDMADQLRQVSGGLGVTCRLLFDSDLQADANVTLDTIGKKPGLELSLGGRSHTIFEAGEEITDIDPNGNNGLSKNEVVKDIEARVRPVIKPSERFALGIEANINIWQMNTIKEYLTDIEACNSAILHYGLGDKQIRVKLLRPPEVYGLGGAMQCRCFWEQMG